jgi:hypothetical protein
MNRKYNEEYFLTEIKNKFDFLFNDYNFNIVSSEMLNYNGYQLLICSSDLFIEFYFDRNKVWMVEISKNHNVKDAFSLGTIKQYLDGTENDNELFSLDESSHFLKNNLDTILDLFDSSKYSETIRSLTELSDKLVNKRFPGINYKSNY